MAVQTITYDNKVALNVNPDIADVNKVTDNDMNEIKSVVNNNANNIGDLSNLETQGTSNLVSSINSANKVNIFSTTEQLIGKWIDGSDLYRIVLSTTGTFSNSNYNIGALNDNYKMRFCFGTFFNSSNNNEYTLSNPTTEIRHISGNMNVKFDTSWGDGTVTLIVYYTK